MKYLNPKTSKLIFSLCIFFLSVASALAQQSNTGSIKGKVQTSDGKPAEGVSISVKTLNRTTIANNDGI